MKCCTSTCWTLRRRNLGRKELDEKKILNRHGKTVGERNCGISFEFWERHTSNREENRNRQLAETGENAGGHSESPICPFLQFQSRDGVRTFPEIMNALNRSFAGIIALEPDHGRQLRPARRAVHAAWAGMRIAEGRAFSKRHLKREDSKNG